MPQAVETSDHCHEKIGSGSDDEGRERLRVGLLVDEAA
jgi:hypothetical protein